jgi:hypothetical protein
MPLAQTVTTVFGAALLVLAASADMGLPQTGDSASPPVASHRDGNKIPEKIAPENSGSSTEPLSNQLNRSGGVIHPPSGVDTGMTQTPPKIGPHSTPVIPPPGDAGTDEVKPK